MYSELILPLHSRWSPFGGSFRSTCPRIRCPVGNLRIWCPRRNDRRCRNRQSVVQLPRCQIWQTTSISRHHSRSDGLVLLGCRGQKLCVSCCSEGCLWVMYGTNGGINSSFNCRYLVSKTWPELLWSAKRLGRFVHERGFRTAIFNLGVLGGINLAVPIGERLHSLVSLLR